MGSCKWIQGSHTLSTMKFPTFSRFFYTYFLLSVHEMLCENLLRENISKYITFCYFLHVYQHEKSLLFPDFLTHSTTLTDLVSRFLPFQALNNKTGFLTFSTILNLIRFPMFILNCNASLIYSLCVSVRDRRMRQRQRHLHLHHSTRGHLKNCNTTRLNA